MSPLPGGEGVGRGGARPLGLASTSLDRKTSPPKPHRRRSRHFSHTKTQRHEEAARCGKVRRDLFVSSCLCVSHLFWRLRREARVSSLLRPLAQNRCSCYVPEWLFEIAVAQLRVASSGMAVNIPPTAQLIRGCAQRLSPSPRRHVPANLSPCRLGVVCAQFQSVERDWQGDTCRPVSPSRPRFRLTRCGWRTRCTAPPRAAPRAALRRSPGRTARIRRRFPRRSARARA